MTRIIFIIYLSDVPKIEPEQGQFFDNLRQAIKDILNLSDEWHIEVWKDYSSSERRVGLNNNIAVNILLTSSLAGPGDIAMLEEKLDRQEFMEQLQSKGFKASKASPQLTSTGYVGLSSFVVGVCSAAGVMTGLVLLFCTRRFFFSTALNEYIKGGKNDNVLSENEVDSSLDESLKEPDKEIADETITSAAGDTSDCNLDCIVTEMASRPSLFERQSMDQINSADYSKALEDVLQLISGLGISIKSFFDPCLRKEIQASIQHSNEITPHDQAAVLQIIRTLEGDTKSLIHSTEQKDFSQHQIGEGPLTELHFLAMKLIFESEIQDSIAVNGNKTADLFEIPKKSTNFVASQSASEIVGGGVACDKPLVDILLLLKKCDLEPSYLLQKESRKLIEDNLTNRKEPLLAEHFAVLQLLSKAEIDSDLSIDSLRKRLLEKRIKEGPLNADHLWAAQSLSKLERDESCELVRMGHLGPAETILKVQLKEIISQQGTADLVHQAEPVQHKSCILNQMTNELDYHLIYIILYKSNIPTNQMQTLQKKKIVYDSKSLSL